jgi:hypothetical protein
MISRIKELVIYHLVLPALLLIFFAKLFKIQRIETNRRIEYNNITREWIALRGA